MLKKISVILVLLAFTLSACTINGRTISFSSDRVIGSGNVVTEERDISEVNMVDLKAVGNLTIEIGDEESFTITADDNLMKYITSDVFNHTLEIDMEPNFSFDPTTSIEYKLVVKELKSVVLSGFGNITVGDLTSEDLEIKLAGSGDINLGTLHCENALLRVSGFGDITADTMVIDQPSLEITGSGNMTVEDLQAFDLNLKISGFGNAELSGKADDQEIQILGSGNYDGQDLKSDNAVVKITGLGDASVWAEEKLDVTITGSGNLEYYGSPEVTQTMSGFGKVNSMGEH